MEVPVWFAGGIDRLQASVYPSLQGAVGEGFGTWSLVLNSMDLGIPDFG
jgi:hypothetical protein